MNKTVPKTLVKGPLKFFRRLMFALVCLFAAQGVWGETYYWVGDASGEWTTGSNWNTQDDGNGSPAPTGGPGEGDSVYIIDGSEINIPSTNNSPVNITIANLSIANNNNTATINLGKNTLTMTEMHLGTETDGVPNGHRNIQGKLKITSTASELTNPNVIITTFDLYNAGNNYLYLQNISCNVTTNYYVNGSGNSKIEGTGSSFSHPEADSQWGTDFVISFDGDVTPTEVIGEYSVTINGTPSPGNTITITVTNSTTAFSKLKYNAIITGTGETYNVKVNDNIQSNITANSSGIDIDFDSSVKTQNFSVDFPATISVGNGIKFVLFAADGTTNLGTLIDYTQQSIVNIWTGNSDSDWDEPSNWSSNDVPDNDSNVVIPSGKDHYPELGNISTSSLGKLTIQSGASITITTNGTINANTITNNGTIEINGGTVNSSTSIINKGSITVTSGTIHATTSVSNYGTITFGNGVINIETQLKSNGNSSKIIYDGATSPIWGNVYKNLKVSSGTVTFENEVTITNDFENDSNTVFEDTTIITGIATNNGTINIKKSLSAASFTGATGTINLNGTSGSATSLTTTNTSATSSQSSIVLKDTNTSIKGKFTLNTFTATDSTMSGKSITLNDAIITASTISMHGSDSSRLSLIGSGTNHKFSKSTSPASSMSAEYLSIDSDILLENHSAEISNSIPTADNDIQNNWITVLNNGWNIRDLSSFTYTWTGATNTDWEEESNWDTGYVPGTDCKIVIPSGCTRYPILTTGTYNGGTLTLSNKNSAGTTVTPVNSKITLGSNNLVLSGTENGSSSAILTNYGTIIYTNIGRITNGIVVKNDTEKGKVQYASDGTGTIENTIEYYDLEVLGTGWEFSGDYKIKNILTINNTATAFANACAVTGVSTIQAGSFDFQGLLNFKENLTLAPYNSTSEFTIPSNLAEKVNTSEGKRMYLGTGTTPGNIKFDDTEDFSYELYLNSTATITSGKEIKLQKSITATNDINGEGTLSFTGNGEQVFETNGKTFAKIKEEKADGSSLTINGTPTITTFATTDNSKGNLIFSSSANITNGFTKTYGTTTISGDLTTTNSILSVSSLVLSNDATINTGTGVQTYGTINGANGTTALKDLTLTASSVTFKDDIGATKSLKILTVNAPIIIDSSGKQIIASEIDFSGNITGTGNTLLINTGTLKSTISSGTTTITLNELGFSQNTTSIQTQNATTLAFNVRKLSGISKTVKLESPEGASTNRTFSFTGNVEIEPIFQILNNTTLKASTGTITFKSDVDLSNGTFNANGGTVVLAGTTTNGTSQTLTTKSNGTTSFNNLVIKGNVTINNSNTIANLTAADSEADDSYTLAGKTITFGAGTTQTVTNMTLKGMGTGTNLLTLKSSGSGNWSISCTNEPVLDYLSVQKSTNSTPGTPAPGTNFVAYHSTDAGGNTYWAFPNMTYTWLGTTSTVWNVTTNWDGGVVPTKGAAVVIAHTDNNKYPKLTEEINLDTAFGGAAVKGSITVNANAEFDLAGENLTVGTITNNGLIKLVGKSNQISGKMKNVTASTVEYCGGTFESFAWDGDDGTNTDGKQYANLIINEAITQSSTEVLDVSGLTTIKANSSLNNSSNIFASHVKIGDSTSSVNAGTVILNGTAGKDSNNNDIAIFLENNILANTLTLNNNVQGADLTINAPLIINASSISTTGAQTYNGTVSLGTETSPATHTLNASGISFVSTINGAAALQVITTDGTSFGGNVGTYATPITSLSVTGPSTIGCSNIYTSVAQTYGGAVTLGINTSLTSSGGDISFGTTASPVTIDGDKLLSLNIPTSKSITVTGEVGSSTSVSNPPSITIAQAGNVTFEKDVTVSAFEITQANVVEFKKPVNSSTFNITKATSTTFDETVAIETFTDDAGVPIDNGAITFAKGGNITAVSGVTFNTTGNVTFASTSPSAMTIAGPLVHTAGSTSITGTLNTASVNLGANGKNINLAGSVITTGAQSYNGAVTLGAQTSLTSSNAGQVTFGSSATINGGYPLSITAEGTGTTTGITFNANIGNTTALSTISITEPLNINCSSIKTTGNQTYGGAVTLSKAGNIILTAQNASNAYQTVQFNGNIDNLDSAIQNLIVDAKTKINCEEISVNSATFNQQVTLLNDTTITTDSDSSAKLIFKKSLSSEEGTSHSLTTAGGSVDFKDTITELSSLTTTATATFDGIVNVGTLNTQIAKINCASITTTGNQTYNDEVTLSYNGEVTLTAKNNSNVYQTVQFNGNVGKSTTGTHNLIVDAKTNINCATITASSAKFNQPVVLLHDTTITTDSADTAKLIFEKSLSGGTAPGHSLTTAGGSVDFKDTISGVSTLTTAATAIFDGNVNVGTLNTNIAKINCASVTTTGNQTFNGAVTLLNDGNITLTAKASDDVYQTIRFNENIGQSDSGTENLFVDGNTSIYCSDINVNNVDFKQPVTLYHNVKITADSGNTIHFEKPLAGAYAFETVTGSAQFDDTITNLTSLKTDATATFNGDVTVTTIDAKTTNINCDEVSTTGSQTYRGPVVSNAQEITSANSTITFKDELEIHAAAQLTATNAIFEKAVTINGNTIITTSETISFLEEITGDHSLETQTGSVSFAKSITGLTALTTDASAVFADTVNVDTLHTQTARFNGNVTADSIETQAATNFYCSTITTTGNQTYNGTVTIRNPAELSSDDTISFYNSLTLSADTTLTADSKINYKSTITDGGTGIRKILTIDSPVFNSTAASGNSVTITLGTLRFARDETSLESTNNNTTVNLNAAKIDGVGKTVVVDSSLANFAMTHASVVVEPNIQTEPGSKFTAASGTTTFNSDVDFANGTLDAHGGEIKLTAENKTSANPVAELNGNNTYKHLTFSGGVTMTGNNVIEGALLLTGTAPVRIEGSNTITNLTAGNNTTGLGGKTITFGAGKTQTVTGNLQLIGTANLENNRLVLRSSVDGTSWIINCEGANTHNIRYVDIKDSNNISANQSVDYNLFALNSNDRGNNVNWNFPEMQYTWVGGTNSAPDDWNTKENWSPASIPNKGAVVSIPADKSSYPVLTVPLDLNDRFNSTDYSGTITVAANAIFDLADENLTVGTITNNGLVRLNGADGQTIHGTMINGIDSTVEYYPDAGTTTITNFAWDGEGTTPQEGKQYEKLHVNSQVNISDKITVNKTTAITAGTGKSVTLNNAGNVFIGNIMLGNSSAATPATSINAGAVTLNSSGTITLDDNAYADSFVCNCPVKLKNITTIGNQTYNGLVSLLDSATFKTTGDSALITLNASLKGDGSSDKSLTIDSALRLITNCSYINNLDAVTFKTPVEILSNTKITTATGEKILFKDEITGTGSLETITGSVVFEKTITNLASLKTAATATFNDDVDIGILNTQKAKINCDSITANIATFGDSVILLSDTQITTDAAATATDTANLIFKKDVYGSGNYSLETIDGSVIFDDVINDITSLTTDATATFNGNLTAGTLHTQIAKINCAEIITTGNQTYDGTVTLFKAGDIKLTAKNGSEYNTVQFNANVNNSTAGIENLIVDAKTNINCAAITVNNATFNQPVTLLHDTTITTDSADEAKLIFKKSLSGGDAPGHSLTTATGSVEFEDTITRLSSLTTAATATFNGNVSTGTITTLRANINCSSITTNSTTTANQTYNGAVEILTDTTLSISSGSSGTITFTSAVNGNNKLSFEAGPNNIIFNNKVGKSETATQSESPLKELKISTAANTTFNDIVCIGTFTDTASSGNIFFKKSGKINTVNQQTFNTTGNVVFGDTNNDNAEMLLCSNITHVAGTTKLYGKLTAPELDITLGNSEITGTITAENITLGQTENAVITGGPMTITNTGLFKTVDGASLNFTTSFTQNGTGNSVIGGTFTGNGPATFATDVMIYGTTAANFGTSGQTITIGAGSSAADKNLIISRTAPAAAPLTINAATVIAKNIVLYKGAVILNGNMTANQDMIILGADYSTTDSDTGITDEYSYYCARPSIWSQPNYNEARLPDGTTAPGMTATTGDFTATLSTSADKTVTVKKNFYANGTALSVNGTSGQWRLKLPDITNAANGFAEAYHSSISGCNVICSNGSTDGTKARLVTLECTDAASNTNVDFDDFQITAAWTERDNSIRVEFNRPVRYHNATVEALKFLNAADSPVLDFAASTTEFDLYSDPDCQHTIEYDTQLNYFYIKATPQNGSEYGSWNTDATGKTSGEAQSTDRSGIHHQTKPAFDFPRALSPLPYIITDRWGKRLVNYSTRTPSAGVTYGSTNDTTNEVLDKTGPVLYSVRTGQELHNTYDSSVGEACEHSYDSHNFIEFVYSEKVDFNGTNNDASLNAPLTSPENIQVTDSLGAIMGDITKSENLRIAGLGTVQHGLIYTGSSGRTDKYVNALYRNGSNAEYSIKLSIAGYINGTVTDTNNFTYKKWTGYIEQAEMPSGTVKHLVNNDKKNERVKDKAGNVQIKYENDSSGQSVYDTIPVVNSTESGLYGAWDISEPVFAIIRYDKSEDKWISSQFNSNQQVRAEAIGNNSGVGSTLDRIEFHLYDNTPNPGSTEPEWFTEVGWCNPNSDGDKDTDLYKSYSYAADIFGGARPFDTDESRRTSGGVRYSTIHSAVSAFKYGVENGAPVNNFDTSKIASGGASSLIFTGVSSPRRSAGNLEGLYFSLPLENTTFDITKSFTIKYDESKGYITDLAGNRLRSKTFTTIDRTPPSIDMTVCPVGDDELDIIFVKKISTNSEELKYYVLNENNEIEKVNIQESFENLITGCFDFITIDSSGMYHVVDDLTVDQTVPAQISITTNKNDSSFTSIRLKLSRTVTLDDIKNLYVRVKSHQNYDEESIDLFTGHSGSRVTFIQDRERNNIQMYTAHALSDFAVGVINPLYAYDSAMTEDDGSIVTDSLFHKNLTDDVDIYGWSVHDWNRDQQNYGTLPAKRPVAIVADTSDGTLENENAPDSFRVYLANNPDALSVSTQYNNDLEPSTSWRIWLPDETSDVFTALSEKNNTKYSQVDGTLLSEDKSDRMIFELDESITNKWAAGNQISFLFGLTNSDGTPVTIMHSPELDINNDMQYLPSSVKMPLFALRQTDPEDLMSLDLWSFKLKTNISQRGGVTILNNVIDSAAGEKAVIKVDVPEDGTLTVLVMTLDGNIVDYLHRGSAKAGEHFYTWDGSNRKGNPVARGMYFIRVIGPGLDETRKVLVIKE